MRSPQRSNHALPGDRRAKIVCTIGPATRSAVMIDRLVRAGMDVARLNFSHGTYAEHALTVTLIRAASARYQKPIAILADLPGPKIRTGMLEGGHPVTLRGGQRFTISTRMAKGDADTLACITGGIAEAHYGGVPPHIAGPALAALDERLRRVVTAFRTRYQV